MSSPVLFSIIESPAHPDFSTLYGRLGIDEIRMTSIRKSIGKLKTSVPNIVVAEFFYGYSNNYAGVNISNLDVLLYSLQKFAPQARVIVMVEKHEQQYVAPLHGILPLQAVLPQPVREADMETVLKDALHGTPG